MENVIGNESAVTILAPVLATVATDLSKKLIDTLGFERLEFLIPVGAGAVDASHTAEFIVEESDLDDGTGMAEVSEYVNATREDESAWDKLLNAGPGDAGKLYRIEVKHTKRYVRCNPSFDTGFDTVLGVSIRGVNPINKPVTAAMPLITLS